jgi:hypothetical protein
MFFTSIRSRMLLAMGLGALLASACLAQAPSTSPIPTLNLPVATLDSPVPTLDSRPGEPELVGPLRIPTPESSRGTVAGTLNDKFKGVPHANRYIYLARVNSMESTTGGEPVYFAELDTAAAPYSQTDVKGQFLFKNVEPGKYAFVEWLPNLEQTLLYDADTNINLSVEVKPGEISDLGTLDILGTQ